MTRLLTISGLIFLLGVPPTTVATPPARTCKGNPKIIADCFTIHGRMQWTNGTPDLRIWRVGTNRVLGVVGADGTPDDSESPILPKNLKLGFEDVAYGDFEVCPFTKDRPEEMRMVCVQSAKNVIIRKDR